MILEREEGTGDRGRGWRGSVWRGEKDRERNIDQLLPIIEPHLRYVP